MTGMQGSPPSSDTAIESLSDSGMSQRVPKCARCRCHGINCELKGHKEKCPFKDCQCRSCLLVVERQKITATRVAHLRHQRKIDKQRNSGYYNAYTGLTEEEEYVLTRYADGAEQKIKRHMAYECIDGPPYKVPAVRYNGYHDPKPYSTYYQPGPWEYQRGNRLSPCTQECCMPWKERSFPENHFAVRKLYDEDMKDGKTGGRLTISPSAHGHLHENRRPFNQPFHLYAPYRIQQQEPRSVGYDTKRDPENGPKAGHDGNGNTKKHIDNEAEIEVDVVKVQQDEDEDGGVDESRVMKSEIKMVERRMTDGEVELRDEVRNRADMINDYQRSTSRHSDASMRRDIESIKTANEIEEQRRKRDEFIRSKCGDVLSVMFPDFDGRLIRRIAERSDYDIQKSVEQLLEIKKQKRVNDTKSAFSAYKDMASPNGGKPPCQCCAVRPVPVADMKPRYFEMRDSAQARNHEGRVHERSGIKRAELEI